VIYIFFSRARSESLKRSFEKARVLYTHTRANASRHCVEKESVLGESYLKEKRKYFVHVKRGGGYSFFSTREDHKNGLGRVDGDDCRRDEHD
jgi:hypothetical protein